MDRETEIILPSDFFSQQSEKTKLNWFCFD
jgi:hypothetical protein